MEEYLNSLDTLYNNNNNNNNNNNLDDSCCNNHENHSISHEKISCYN